jgi:NAD(P)-dependent dehydrogenase (short-subunit alcohol dehydrogenase family)
VRPQAIGCWRRSEEVSGMPWELKDSVVVITGASSGIGRATAHALAEHGASVVLAARSEQSLREVANECEAAGGRVLAVPTDVSDKEAVQDLARQAADRFGRIDIWVNNAGVMAYGYFEQVPDETYRQVIETNLFGTINGARAALPYFREQGSGVLINISSLWGRMFSPYVSAYTTSKFGVRTFSESLREALADEEDIDVCTILPQSVDTPIFRHAANYSGRGAKPVPPIVDPSRVVRAVLRCIEHPQREVSVGFVGHLEAIIQETMPGPFNWLAPYVMRWAAFSSEPAESKPGNVFQPMPEWNQVTGGWRSKRKTVLRHAAVAGGVALPPMLVYWLRRRRT